MSDSASRFSTAPDYWGAAITHLSNDVVMQAIITRFPTGTLVSRGDPFYTLMRSIVGQQVSVKAADAIWGRVEALCQKPLLEGEGTILSPTTIPHLTDDELRACGLSRQKIRYVRSLAEFFIEEAITPDVWDDMGDEAVIRHVTQVKGIGRWTAEMFLMFCLLRPDVFPLDDLGLQRAISQAYGLDYDAFCKRSALKLSESWQPYRSVATWYLWRSIDPAEVCY